MKVSARLKKRIKNGRLRCADQAGSYEVVIKKNKVEVKSERKSILSVGFNLMTL